MPEFPLQAAPEMRDAPLCCFVKFPLLPGVRDPGYAGASHTYGCRILFSSSQVYTRIEADKFLSLLSEHFPSGFIIPSQSLFFSFMQLPLFFFFFNF